MSKTARLLLCFFAAILYCNGAPTSFQDEKINHKRTDKRDVHWQYQPTLRDVYETQMLTLDTGREHYSPLTDFSETLVVENLRMDGGKYFHETPYSLVDTRFANEAAFADMDHRRKMLVDVVKAWSDFCMENNLITWMAHGTLLGWFWGQKIFPWDKDLDYQMPLADMIKLSYFNGTKYKHRFLIDVNPHIVNRGHEFNNIIDARFIDTRNGLYADITALSTFYYPNVSCKSVHMYPYNYIFPLHSTTFEGVDVWRPHDSVSILVQEFKEESMQKTLMKFDDYSFEWNDDEKSWKKVHSY
ncbi:hypothetical protein HK098_005232 [Nowakowskiella sp. JEL0407]|nr:hypothetical protein HK098_005232 [Nowakowskiella sp. JEL0407]